MVADDQYLPPDPAFAGGAVGGQHVNVEVVVAREADRLGMQRDRFTGGDLAADDGIDAVEGK